MKRMKKDSIRKVKDADIDYSDIPELSDEQLKKFRRVGRPLVEIRQNSQLSIGYIKIHKGKVTKTIPIGSNALIDVDKNGDLLGIEIISLKEKPPKKSIVINEVELLNHDPSKIFGNHKGIKQALSEAFMDGDKEAFLDILSGYVRGHNILEDCRRTGLSRTVVYEAISGNGNPSLDTLFKIMTSFK